MNKKILTVSVAAYNVEAYIRECLTAFLSLDDLLGEIEVLIVDDGGTDGTRDIAMEFVIRYPETFKFVHKENGGWGSTVNTGIELAAGRYFKQLDGDDYYNPESLKAFIRTLESTDADLVYSPYREFEDGTNKILDSIAFSGNAVQGEIITFGQLDRMASYIAMHSCTFKTALLQSHQIRLLEHCFYTDSELYIKAAAFAETALIFNQPVYCYRLGRAEQSVSIKGLQKHYLDNVKVIETLIAFERSGLVSSERQPYIHKYIAGSISWQYIALIRLRKLDELRQFDEWVQRDYGYQPSDLQQKVIRYRRNDFRDAVRLYRSDVRKDEIRAYFRTNPLTAWMYMMLRKMKHRNG